MKVATDDMTVRLQRELRDEVASVRNRSNESPTYLYVRNGVPFNRPERDCQPFRGIRGTPCIERVFDARLTFQVMRVGPIPHEAICVNQTTSSFSGSFLVNKRRRAACVGEWGGRGVMSQNSVEPEVMTGAEEILSTKNPARPAIAQG